MPRERALFLRLSQAFLAKRVCQLGPIRASIYTANYTTANCASWAYAHGHSCGFLLDLLGTLLAVVGPFIASDCLRDLTLMPRVTLAHTPLPGVLLVSPSLP
jgi:hypothetical protein